MPSAPTGADAHFADGGTIATFTPRLVDQAWTDRELPVVILEPRTS